MIWSSIPPILLSITLSIACNEADDKIGAAMKEADQKVKNAEQDEGTKVAEAQAGFMRMREDYRHTTRMNLAELYHKVDDLEARARASTGNARTELDASLKQIHTERGTFETHYMSLETATPSTWDEAKARLDKEWTHLKTLVDKT